MSRNTRRLFAVCVCAVMSISLSNSLLAGGPDTLRLGKIELQQNGSGYRVKGLLTLYEGSLYLPEPSRDAGAIVKAESPMAIRIEITSGFVSQQKMIQALEEGLQNATGGNLEPIQAQIEDFRQCFADAIKKGDVFVLSYHPGHGILVHKNSQQKGLVAGAGFKEALFGIWLSDRPCDERLKQAMLGK